MTLLYILLAVFIVAFIVLAIDVITVYLSGEVISRCMVCRDKDIRPAIEEVCKDCEDRLLEYSEQREQEDLEYIRQISER